MRFKNRAFITFSSVVVLLVLLFLLFHNSETKKIRLVPGDTDLGKSIAITYGVYEPPIWLEGTHLIQGDIKAPWISAAKALIVKPGDPIENVSADSTISYLQNDFSIEAYRKSQKFLESGYPQFKQTAFYWIKVETNHASFLMVCGTAMELLNTQPKNTTKLSCSLYELENNRWKNTSTKANDFIFLLPWQNLSAIKDMVESGVAKKQGSGTWGAFLDEK